MPWDGLHRKSMMRVGGCIGLALLFCGCGHTNGYLMNLAGTRYFQQGNYTAARDNFQRAVADNPHNADYVHNLATAMKKQGDWVGAERNYFRALNLVPSHQPSYHSLAMLYNEQGRQVKSAGLLRGWADTQPYIPESHIELAWLQREMGDLSGAEQSLQKSLRVAPGNHVAMAQLGQLYQNSGQPDRALAMFQRSLHTNWFQPQVQSRVAALGRSPSLLASRPMHASPPMAFTGNPHTAAITTPYGISQRVALSHPLLTYGQPGITFPVNPPSVIAAPSIQLGAPVVNTDPAHTPVISGDIPEVRPH